MKTKLLLSSLLSFSFYLLSSQVPQGFNYQAIARDNKGNPIPSAIMQVRIGILSDTIANTMIWEELFNPVTTNAFGMFSIVVGTGFRQSGSAGSFSEVDWTKTPLFLRTSVYYPNSWKIMGTSKLQSVPYSMIAANLQGAVPLLSVRGSTSTMDSALFVVRNNTGQIVFAVYNEGVRIYVDNGVVKGATKGGFAIGSFDGSKGTSQPLFVVDPDSIRAYLDNNPVKAVKGGFAIGGFDRSKSANQNFLSVSKDSIRIYIDDNLTSKSSKKGGFAIGSFDKTKGGNINYLNVSTDSTGIIDPAENRILWYPLKDAFLTGKVLIESKDSVGVNSFASGYQSKSKGQYSQALGYKAIARGDYSTAIGKNALANKINSFAFGDSSRAVNSESYAFGRGAMATGYRSFAFGSAGVDSAGNVTDVSRSKGDYSFVVGQGSQSFGKGAFAIGLADTAKGDYSVALGYKTSAGYGSSSLGYQTKADNVSTAMGIYTVSLNASTAMGQLTIATGINSTAMGYYSTANGYGSTAMGMWSMASGSVSIAMGRQDTASGANSAALGYKSIATGNSSMSLGNLSYASGDFSTALGQGRAIGNFSTAIGPTTAQGQGSTSIGNSSQATGSYSTTMGQGSIASGQNSISIGYGSVASGDYSTSYGYATTALSGFETSLGSYNTGYTPISKTGWDPSDRLFVIGNGYSAPSNAVTVLKNGNFGLGTSTPGYRLTVNGTAWCSSGAWTGSDIRWKKNIVEINDVLKNVLTLRPVKYQLRSDDFPEMNFTNEVQIGLIAQDVEKVFPNLVMTDNNGYKAVSYEKLSVVLVEGIKEQQKQIASQQQQIESNRQENQQLRTELDELKALVNSLVANQSGISNK